MTNEELRLAVDTSWVLMTAFLVFLMQAGFAMVEAGMTQMKNMGNIMMKNLMDFVMATIAFFCVGFAVMFGSGNDFFGFNGFFLVGDTFESLAYSGVPIEAKFVFQVMFAGTAATIVSGVMAERTHFTAYLIASAITSALIYPVVGHWIWGGGWLAKLEFLDFAGSTVVHTTGGIVGLVGAILLGPRLGKYAPDGASYTIPNQNKAIRPESGVARGLKHQRVPHRWSTTYFVLGTMLLWFGWYGFNAGSTLAADPAAIGLIALNTSLGAAAGAITAMIVAMLYYGRPDIGSTANGTLIGLVAITAGCRFVEPWAALVIGGIGGAVLVPALQLIDRKVDDPVGAVSVHAVGGVVGTLLVGVFASPRLIEAAGAGSPGLVYGGGLEQLGTQAVGSLAVLCFVFVAATAMFAIIQSTVGLRVPRVVELTGLDIAEHGVVGYDNPSAPDVGSGWKNRSWPSEPGRPVFDETPTGGGVTSPGAGSGMGRGSELERWTVDADERRRGE